MKNKLSLLAVAALLMLPAIPSAHAADNYDSTRASSSSDENGNYERKSSMEQENGNGTVVEQEDSLKVNKDSKGNVDRKAVNKTSVDPKGLFNKKTQKVTDETKINADGTSKHKHKVTVNGDTVEENSTETSK